MSYALWRRANAAAMTHKVPTLRRPIPLDMTPPATLKTAPELRYVDRQWHVAYVRPMAEESVLARSTERMPIWAPMRTVWVREGNRRTRQHRPLFPRYVFVGLETGLWGPAMRIRGVDALIMVDGRPCVVSESAIADLGSRQQKGEFDGTVPGRERSQVEILSGPLAGFVAWLELVLPKNETGQVRLMMLGREQVVTMPLANLRRVG